MPSQSLPGFREFAPPDFALRAHIFAVWRDVAHRYGFEEYDGPPLEPLDLYTGKSGDEIVGQLYNFVDKGEREVALRPEMTPTLARMVGARANGMKKPIRWFSIPQLFRYERQQRGRLREHFQLNCDLIGEAGPLADAEIIALAIDMMRGFGLTSADVRVHVADRRVISTLLQDHGISDEMIFIAFRALDKIDRAGIEPTKDRLREAGITAGQIDAILTLATLKSSDDIASNAAQAASVAAAKHFGDTLDALNQLGLSEWIEVDLNIVRGLAYYTGTVFELFDAKRSLRAICGGGRYDNLLEQLGGQSLPALGFGMGDVVLGELLKERGLHPAITPSIDVFVASVTADDMPDVLRAARELRDAGVRVEYALNHSAVGKQLTLANARGARFAVVIGPDDRASNSVQLKDLAAKSQETLGRAALVSHLSSLLSGASHG